MNPILESDFKKLLGLPLPWEELKGKRLFITGATGFIGGYITKGLAWLNHQLSLNLTLGLLHRSGTQPPFTDPSIEWISGDISANFIPEYFKPDIIIHAASPANRQVISSNPCDVISCNILATRYLLEVASYFSAAETCIKGSRGGLWRNRRSHWHETVCTLFMGTISWPENFYVSNIGKYTESRAAYSGRFRFLDQGSHWRLGGVLLILHVRH